MPIIWHPCNPHQAQDRMYGQNYRVCNRTEKEGAFRCTVCDKEITKASQTASRTEEKEKKR
jgi:hypothetical protein